MEMKARRVLGHQRKGSLLCVVLQKALLLALEREKKLNHMAHEQNQYFHSYGSCHMAATFSMKHFFRMPFPASKHSLLHVRAHLFHFH